MGEGGGWESGSLMCSLTDEVTEQRDCIAILTRVLQVSRSDPRKEGNYLYEISMFIENPTNRTHQGAQ